MMCECIHIIMRNTEYIYTDFGLVQVFDLCVWIGASVAMLATQMALTAPYIPLYHIVAGIAHYIQLGWGKAYRHIFMQFAGLLINGIATKVGVVLYIFAHVQFVYSNLIRM